MKEPLITCDQCGKWLTEQVWTGKQLLCAECWEAKEMRMNRFTVEFRTDERWGYFSAHRFATEAQAIAFANRALQRPLISLIAARVWQAGPSSTGDRMLWDSRDNR